MASFNFDFIIAFSKWSVTRASRIRSTTSKLLSSCLLNIRLWKNRGSDADQYAMWAVAPLKKEEEEKVEEEEASYLFVQDSL